MFALKYKFSLKFYLGIALVVLSLIIGKICLVAFLLYKDSLIRWVSVISYIISWPMLIIGGWWVGQEYVDAVKKYVSYKFYQDSVREGTRRVVAKGKESTKKVVQKTKEGTKRVVARTKVETQKARYRTKQVVGLTKDQTRKARDRTKQFVGKTKEHTRKARDRTKQFVGKTRELFREE